MKKTAATKTVRKIKDLPENISLEDVHFKLPGGGSGYWKSQWGYEVGKAGIWYAKDKDSTQRFPLFLDNLREALEFAVIE